MERPLLIDLFAGCFGWSAGWLELGGHVVGFDLEHEPHHGPVPPGADLILQDVRTIDGARFKDASLILSSSPCQEFSYRAMPWKRAKALGPPLLGLELFAQAFRIQREAIAAAGHFIPMVQENVRGANPWVREEFGRSRWSYGSYHLWGDVPALMPITLGRSVMKRGVTHRANGETNFHGIEKEMTHGRVEDLRRLCSEGAVGASMLRGEELQLSGVSGGGPLVPDLSGRTAELEVAGRDWLKVPSGIGRRTDPGNGARFTSYEDRATKNSGGSWFNIAHNTTSGKGQNSDGRLGNNGRDETVAEMRDVEHERGVKGFTPHGQPLGKNELGRKHGSKSSARKAASARIARIPLALSRHIARTYFPSHEYLTPR